MTTITPFAITHASRRFATQQEKVRDADPLLGKILLNSQKGRALAKNVTSETPLDAMERK